jgi:hypothetical protein
MKTILEKTKMARGRAVVLGLLLTATLTLTAGALAAPVEAKKAVPALKKGVTNLAEKVTTIVGFVADDAVLRLDNDSSEGNATALNLQVEAGKAPMTVNSDTKVDNLNADQIDGKDSSEFLGADEEVQNAANADLLDGKDSTEFLPADGKAADSELLDGQDSTAFFSGKTYVVKETGGGSQQGNGEIIVASATCDTGDRVLGGGGFVGDEEEDIQVGEGPDFDANSTGWITFVRDEGEPNPAQATALCADFGEPHQN